LIVHPDPHAIPRRIGMLACVTALRLLALCLDPTATKASGVPQWVSPIEKRLACEAEIASGKA